ncbi:histidinol-phosphate transaminase [Methylosinus sp. RM1]|uniref:histidinol-phosphate transaminase n=1 Tax=Methylosinus sp. RM1 TaxID=2583817 RepID=UPI0014099FDD|nr:histidinol-phosphate transaminase [Methylosinus sp. RM1]
MRNAIVSDLCKSLLRPEVTALPPYDPGADPTAVKAESGVSKVTKLSNNENPLGISPLAMAALAEEICDCGKYPDPAANSLRRALAARLDVPKDRIIIGNGSENILELLCQAFLSPGDRVVTQTPRFGLHEIFPMMMGAYVDKVRPRHDFSFDASAWERALSSPTKMIMLCNPSNPLGAALTKDEFRFVMNSAARDVFLVIDEAYFEFAKGSLSFPDALEELRAQSRAWMVLRTFSKAYGLAGLRVGYGVASHSSVVDALDRVRTPYNVNHLAQRAAIAALEDEQHLRRTIDLIDAERHYLNCRLREAGFVVAPSLANFLFVDTGRPSDLVTRELLKDGVIVKGWREIGFESFVRVTIGERGDNDMFLEALARATARIPQLSWEHDKTAAVEFIGEKV